MPKIGGVDFRRLFVPNCRFFFVWTDKVDFLFIVVGILVNFSHISGKLFYEFFDDN
jgi:hypothetical protein